MLGIFNENRYNNITSLEIKKKLLSRDLNPDDSILEAIQNAKTGTSIKIIAFCLRYGANPNIYITLPGFSNHIHLLGYVYAKHHNNPPLLNVLLPLLILGGSSLTAPIYDEKIGLIRDEKSHLTTSYVSVSDWLYTQGYVFIKSWLELGLDKGYPNPNIIKSLRSLLEEKTDLDNEFIIRSLSDKLSKSLVSTKLSKNWVNIDIENSITYFNLEALRTFLTQGLSPGYPMINDMILDAIKYRKSKDTIVATVEIIEMLSLMISFDLELDHHQISMLRNLDTEMFEKLSSAYQKPIWRKVCKAKKDFPIELKRYLVEADIEIDSGTCSYLESLSSMDPKEVEAASIQRRGKQITSDLSQITDYITGKDGKSIMIDNRGLMKRSAAEYSSMNEIHYRDENGENWVFTSDLYPDLLSDKVNPYTGNRLPDRVLEMVSFRQKMLVDLGIVKPSTISESLKKLWSDENFTSPVDHDENYIHQLNIGGLTLSEKELYKLNPRIIEDKLKSIGIITRISELNQKHAITTLLWIIHWFYNEDKGMARLISGQLNIITT